MIYNVLMGTLDPTHSLTHSFTLAHGPRRVKKSELVKRTFMASAGARAYNGGLAAEPPTGVQGAEPPVRVKGAKQPAADEVFVFKTVIFNASATVLHEMIYCLS